MDPNFKSALDATRNLAPTASNIDRMGRQFGPQLARAAFEQWTLRTRAKAKFARADEMLFDREGLEMATHERVAEFHASLFPRDEHIVDMTCGLGADLIAFSRIGLAAGFDIDPKRIEMARHNLEVHGLEAVLIQDSNAGNPVEYGYADPARRRDGRRVSRDAEAYEPNLDEIDGVLRRAKGGALKLSPLLDDRVLKSLGGDIAFISFERECREALVLYGVCRKGHAVSAVLVDTGEWLQGDRDLMAGVEALEEFLYEADPAAIRAHALPTLCEKFALMPLGDSNGYLTGGTEVSSSWLRKFRVLSSGKADLPTTRSKLEELGSATPVIKQRAAGIDAAKLQRELKQAGKRPLAVAVWPVGKSLRHTIIEPLDQ